MTRHMYITNIQGFRFLLYNAELNVSKEISATFITVCHLSYFKG